MRNPSFSVLDLPPPASALPAFLRDVLSGLAGTQKAIPPRWFYDEKGSRLFEDITRLPEYYPTRCERQILAKDMQCIAPLLGRDRVLVEFGAGSATKTSELLEHASVAEYIAIDISGDFLRQSVSALQDRFPHIPMHALEADFLHPLELPASVRQRGATGFFPGSTLGNLSEAAAVDLLRGFGKALGQDAALLLGVDLLKEESILLPAYDDSQGVTAAFNLNVLHRVNRELQGTVPVSAFEHEARWNESFSRVEMHLRATRDMEFCIGDRYFSMEKGETIHTENSYKYTTRDIRLLLRAGGWNVTGGWTDSNGYFAVIAAKRIPLARAQDCSAG
jgi:dimethylhistidine N-methyltransferase